MALGGVGAFVTPPAPMGGGPCVPPPATKMEHQRLCAVPASPFGFKPSDFSHAGAARAPNCRVLPQNPTSLFSFLFFPLFSLLFARSGASPAAFNACCHRGGGRKNTILVKNPQKTPNPRGLGLVSADLEVQKAPKSPPEWCFGRFSPQNAPGGCGGVAKFCCFSETINQTVQDLPRSRYGCASTLLPSKLILGHFFPPPQKWEGNAAFWLNPS